MITIDITDSTNWQEVQNALKSKGDRVFVMSEAELAEHTKKAVATEWLMAELDKANSDKINGRFTSYTLEEFEDNFVNNIVNLAAELRDRS
ncbi:MAG: hypothetical protein FWB72_05845 [Firmicutes bacterium]|nr:hypothetical protein [Bacillota bacterium]